MSTGSQSDTGSCTEYLVAVAHYGLADLISKDPEIEE